MVSSNTTTGDKPLFLQFPSVVTVSSAAALAVLLLAPSSLSCGDANITAAGAQTVGRNTTANSIDIYRRLGVRQPHNTTKVFQPGLGIRLPLARWSWKLHGALLPLLHIFDDRPPDVFVNLRVLWCKLLVSLDPGSPAYEGEPSPKRNRNRARTRQRGYSDVRSNNKEGEPEPEASPGMRSEDNQLYYATYQMLPPYSIKLALRYLGLWRVFPRWMHANIELRTVYLQTALETVMGSRDRNREDDGTSLESKNDTSSSSIAAAAASTSESDDVPTHGTLNTDRRDKENLYNYNIEHICVIVLGGGYDPRGANLYASYGYSGKRRSRASAVIQQVYELDFPAVVDSKRRLLRRAGFDVVDVVDDRNGTNNDNNQDNDNDNDRGIRLEGIDLNNDAAVDRVLDKIRHELMMVSDPLGENEKHESDPSSVNSTNTTISTADADADAASTNTENRWRWRVVLVSEAVLMYLDPGKAERILEGVAERFRGSHKGNHERFHDASFVFADRLMRRSTNATTTRSMTVPDTHDLIDAEESEVRKWLRDRGWELDELLLKPGATRHLGIATTIST